MTITMTPSRTATGSDFAALSRLINGEGLMERRPAYYLARLGLVTLMFLGGWAPLFLIGPARRAPGGRRLPPRPLSPRLRLAPPRAHAPGCRAQPPTPIAGQPAA